MPYGVRVPEPCPFQWPWEIRQPQIALTRLWGIENTVTKMFPAIVAKPVTVLMISSTSFAPAALENIMAGKNVIANHI